MKLKRSCVKTIVTILAVLGLGIVGSSCSLLQFFGDTVPESINQLVEGPNTQTPPKHTINLAGDVGLAWGTIESSGGTISVDKPGDPLDGLKIDVPAGSYQDTKGFSVSYAPITGHDFGDNFNPATPLISIDNGGGYSDEMMLVTIPAEIPEGKLAMGFFYDKEAGTLEGIPTVEEDADHITIATRHFSDIVVSSVPESELGSDAEVDTGFFPGVDDWQFTNYGSYIAPPGHCAGQSITALWYFTQMKSSGEPSLYGRYNSGTRDFWYDDNQGYRFASTIQRDTDWDAWVVRCDKLKPRAKADSSFVWKQFIYTMKLTGEPQFIYVEDADGTAKHAMICYGASGGALQIADPNYPGDLSREIYYDSGSFDNYSSGNNAQEIKNGHDVAFNLMLYFGTSSLINFDTIATRYNEMLDGSIGNDRFPAYAIQTVNEDGDDIDLSDGFTTVDKNLEIHFSCDISDVNFVVFRDEGCLTTRTDYATSVTLEPGNNNLGFYVFRPVVTPDGENWQYIDYKYIQVKYEPPEPDTSSHTEGGERPVITSFTGPTTFEFDSTNNVVGNYTFTVSVEGGTEPYYYTWLGSRAPQSLTEGEGLNTITIAPSDMRQPGAIKDGFFIWVTVEDAKGQYATWGNGNAEYMYGLKFTGKVEIIDGVPTITENTWEVVTEP